LPTYLFYNDLGASDEHINQVMYSCVYTEETNLPSPSPSPWLRRALLDVWLPFPTLPRSPFSIRSWPLRRRISLRVSITRN
jgi:hypothetical protein